MIILKGSIQAFKNKDILNYVSQETLDEIKKTDPHPLFKKYSVAHEGVSKPRVIGKGTTEISWGARAVRSVKEAIQTGIQCIAGHTKDNIKRGERVVAQVVGKGEEIINGILNAIVVSYFPDKNDSDFDVISMEADLDWYSNGHGMSIAEGITSLSRFALGKSESDIPAFQDAKLLGAIQCFEEVKEKISLGEPSKEKKVPTFAEIQQAVREMKIYPSQLFDRDQIIGDVVIEQNGQISFRGGDANLTSYLLKKLPSPDDVLKDSKAKIEELTKKVTEYEPQISEYSKLKLEQAKLTAGQDVLKYATDRKLTNDQVNWIKIHLDNFTPSDNNEESIKSFVAAQTTKYSEYLKLNPKSAGNAVTTESGKSDSLEQTEFEIKNEMY